MRKTQLWIVVGLMATMAMVSTSDVALSGGVGGRAVSHGTQVLPLAQVPVVGLPTVDRREAALVDAARDEQGEPQRFAEPRQVDLSPENSGTWEVLPGTGDLWRLRVSCPEVLSLNLGFSEFDLPAGAVLRVFAADGTGPVMEFGQLDNRPHGQLWTPVLLTDELVVEFQVPARTAADWSLHLGTVGCGYRFFGEEPADKSGACNIDVVCPEGDPWREQITSVGVYTVNGYWTCSGALVNNTEQDQRPYFLTADHCDVSSVDALSVIVYWNFQSPVCGQQGGGSLTQFTQGSTLRANFADSDFALLELDASPNPAFGVNYAGWDRSGDIPGQAVAIHHPQTDEKSISFENDPLSITTYLESVSPGNGTHLRVADWDLGTTEVGSSGSPLFDGQQRIVGQLHGGYAGCGNDLADWYGRLSQSWVGGGANTNRLSSWLDPHGLGCTTLDLLNPETEQGDPLDPINCPGLSAADNANIRLKAMKPNPFVDYLTLTVEMDREAQTTVQIFDIRGMLVEDLYSGLLVEGENTISWGGHAEDGSRLAGGVYFLVLKSEGKTVKRRFVRLN
jgi:lysyl endopeptidase